MSNPSPTADPRIGARAPRTPGWHRFVAWTLRNFYFRVRVVGSRRPVRPRTLVVSSHRNGAIDGYLVLAAFPRAVFLASAQLLRNPLLRLMFAGIAVVRAKDAQRHHLDPRRFDSPVGAALSCLEQGGCVAVFPEGTSQWGPKPLPYAQGAARVACLSWWREGVPPQVIPVGLFYRCPDRFRSRAEVLVGEPVALPERAGRELEAWVADTAAAIGAALDSVSVHCPDVDTFERVELQAAADSRFGRSYALAFKAREASVRRGDCTRPVAPSVANAARVWQWPCIMIAALLLGPVLLAGLAAGRSADARNTTTMFRMLGGSAAAVVWIPLLVLLAACHPQVVLPLGILAAYGWWCWPEG